jgi:hypothetical protein
LAPIDEVTVAEGAIRRRRFRAVCVPIGPSEHAVKPTSQAAKP